ncbi:arginine-tRNA-protein transferase [Sarocladium implicatum]|nr:arginine-tRNA-protein transferase [Sarocladium implicatum]
MPPLASTTPPGGGEYEYITPHDSHEFKPSRSQRQVINRFNTFVLGEKYVKEAARLYPRSREQAKKRDTEFCLKERIHEAEYGRLQKPPEPAHRLEVTIEDNSFTEEKYAVWDNYQKVVHQDPPSSRSRSSFKRFLCTSGLRSETVVNQEGKEKRLGSVHQCYRLDGKLVAIGILDLLPQCVSSVYFLYDESIARFAPGKLSALGEIALAREGGYRWWYPGYYIHSCPKMRYKMEYSPQSILDPESLEWNDLDRTILDLLDQKSYVSLSRERRLADNRGTEEDGEPGEAGNALIERGFPGLPTVSEMKEVDMDEIAVKFWKDVDLLLQTTDLGTWDASSVADKRGIKRMVAELVGALGADCVSRLCLDMSTYMDD